MANHPINVHSSAYDSYGTQGDYSALGRTGIHPSWSMPSAVASFYLDQYSTKMNGSSDVEQLSRVSMSSIPGISSQMPLPLPLSRTGSINPNLNPINYILSPSGLAGGLRSGFESLRCASQAGFPRGLGALEYQYNHSLYDSPSLGKAMTLMMMMKHGKDGNDLVHDSNRTDSKIGEGATCVGSIVDANNNHISMQLNRIEDASKTAIPRASQFTPNIGASSSIIQGRPRGRPRTKILLEPKPQRPRGRPMNPNKVVKEKVLDSSGKPRGRGRPSGSLGKRKNTPMGLYGLSGLGMPMGGLIGVNLSGIGQTIMGDVDFEQAVGSVNSQRQHHVNNIKASCQAGGGSVVLPHDTNMGGEKYEYGMNRIDDNLLNENIIAGEEEANEDYDDEDYDDENYNDEDDEEEQKEEEGLSGEDGEKDYKDENDYCRSKEEGDISRPERSIWSAICNENHASGLKDVYIDTKKINIAAATAYEDYNHNLQFLTGKRKIGASSSSVNDFVTTCYAATGDNMSENDINNHSGSISNKRRKETSAITSIGENASS